MAIHKISIWLTLCFSIFCLFAFPACSQPTPKDTRAVVQFWHAMSGTDQSSLLNAFVKEFEAANPDIHVIPIYQGNYGQLSQKLIASIIARNPPVMAQMYEGWTSRFLKRDLMDPVQDYFTGPDGLSPAEIEDIWQPFRDNNSWDGKMVTMPFNKSCYVLYANMNMLREAGYNAPPATWDELRAMAKKLTITKPDKSSPDVYGFMMRAQIEGYTMFLFRAGEHILSPDDKKVTLNTPMALETLQLLSDMVNVDKSAYTEGASYPALPFGSGKVAMYVHSSAAFSFNDENTRGKFEWIAAPLPHPQGRQGGILFQGTNIGIFKSDHTPKERLAAWRFLKYITSPKNTARWSIATGYVVVRKSGADVPEMKEFLSEHPNYWVPIRCIPEATFDPRPPYWDQMRPEVATYSMQAINGQLAPVKAMEIMDEKLKEILEYEIGK